MDIDILKRLLAALHARSVRYVLVGGIALNVHGIIRTTEDIESQVADLEGIFVRVATPRMLYRMKSGTVRPIDQADAGNLKRKFNLTDDADR